MKVKERKLAIARRSTCLKLIQHDDEKNGRKKERNEKDHFDTVKPCIVQGHTTIVHFSFLPFRSGK